MHIYYNQNVSFFAILYSVFKLLNSLTAMCYTSPSLDQSSTNFPNEYFQEKGKEEGIFLICLFLTMLSDLILPSGYIYIFLNHRTLELCFKSAGSNVTSVFKIITEYHSKINAKKLETKIHGCV